MNLLEFITWCELKDLVTHREKLDALWDVEVGYHYKVEIHNKDNYKASIIYAVLHDQAVIVRAHLYKRKDNGGYDTWNQPGVRDLIRAFCNDA